MPPRDPLPHKAHRVRRVLVGGVRWHFYAWRGGPKFWEDTQKFPTDPGFQIAYAKAVERPKPLGYSTPQMVDEFLTLGLPPGARTQADYRKFALPFADEFRDDPAAIFEDPDSRGLVNDWRGIWAHSPRQYDYAGTVVTRLLNWAIDQGKIRQHHCRSLPKIYTVDRSDIVWTAADRAALTAKAPEWVARILTAACETGLRAANLCKLNRAQVEATPMGRLIRVRTSKTKRVATIPVTPAMAEVLDATPPDRLLILVSDRGLPLTPHRASEGLRYWRDKAGLTPDQLGHDLRLQDARGTAATRLLNAGLALNQIASHMGWSIRHASAVIEHYARVSPDESDAILVKLEAARAAKA